LLTQRVITGVSLIYCFVSCLSTSPVNAECIPRVIAASGGLLLLAGLWTPIAGALIAAIEIWIALSHPADHCAPLFLAAFGATLAMIGPGAWSIDARLYGRKRILPPDTTE